MIYIHFSCFLQTSAMRARFEACSMFSMCVEHISNGLPLTPPGHAFDVAFWMSSQPQVSPGRPIDWLIVFGSGIRNMMG
jgi:hypothetical protein